MEIKEKVEENLVKKTCRELGITQKELAELTGYSVDTVSKWNRGVNQIPKNAVNHFKLLLKNKISNT